jgi:chromosome partitioning protein
MTTKIIAICNQKGGVGKTTTATTLAHGLALKGRQVLLIDLDPQGQAAVSLGLRPEPGAYYFLTPPPGNVVTVKQWVRPARENLWLVAGDASTNASQAQMNASGAPLDYIALQLGQFTKNGSRPDYILFDTAPSVGGVQERAIFASHYVIVPAATEYLAADGTRKIFEMMLKMQQEKSWPGKIAGVLPTMYDQRVAECRTQYQEYQQIFSRALLSVVHDAAIFRECPGQGRTVFEMKLDSEQDQRAVNEYQMLVNTVGRLS